GIGAADVGMTFDHLRVARQLLVDAQEIGSDVHQRIEPAQALDQGDNAIGPRVVAGQGGVFVRQGPRALPRGEYPGDNGETGGRTTPTTAGPARPLRSSAWNFDCLRISQAAVTATPTIQSADRTIIGSSAKDGDDATGTCAAGPSASSGRSSESVGAASGASV